VGLQYGGGKMMNLEELDADEIYNMIEALRYAIKNVEENTKDVTNKSYVMWNMAQLDKLEKLLINLQND
jgi:hypothetical protein